MLHEIIIWPDSRLRQRAEEVKVVDDSIRALVSDLFETMYAEKGAGLAAPQIGIGKRVFVVDTSSKQDGAQPLAFINPVIVETEGEVVVDEGCLSVPGEFEEVTRACKVRVKALDKDGTPFEVEADGLLAIALQHETDHLEGTVFVDHISALKRELIKRRMKRLKAQREAEKREGKTPSNPRQPTAGL